MGVIGRYQIFLGNESGVSIFNIEQFLNHLDQQLQQGDIPNEVKVQVSCNSPY